MGRATVHPVRPRLEGRSVCSDEVRIPAAVMSYRAHLSNRSALVAEGIGPGET